MHLESFEVTQEAEVDLALSNSYGPFVLSKFHTNNPQLYMRTHPKPGHESIL